MLHQSNIGFYFRPTRYRGVTLPNSPVCFPILSALAKDSCSTLCDPDHRPQQPRRFVNER